MGFNSIVNLEIRNQDRPYNPMINAGAIVTTSLIFGENEEHKAAKNTKLFKKSN